MCRPTASYPLRYFMVRLFIVLTMLGCTLTLSNVAYSQTGKGQAKAKQPNIVMIFADDLTCQAMSCYGDERKLLETPNIDRVAKRGMRFDRCLVTNSICGPSRATILTGKYSHLNGFYNNSNSQFDSTQTSFPPMMQAAGYSTAIIGKWHLISDPVGFDHWDILPGQGIYYNPPMMDGSKANEDHQAISDAKPNAGKKPGNGRAQTRRPGYVTDVISDLSTDWIKQRDPSKPFLLMSQHKAPHREWSPPLRYLGWDNDRQYPEPATLFDDYQGRSKAVSDHDMGLDRTITNLDMKLVPPPGIDAEQRKQWDAYYEPRNEKYRNANLSGRDLVRWRYNRYMHDYLACVKAVDDAVGKMLDCLEAEGIADETVIIISSDQGFYLGEHGWFDKRWIFEESLRTPLIISWPGVTQPASTNQNIVSLLDFAETFLDLAGVAVPDEMQGRSLLPLLRGENPSDWRSSLYYHYYEFPQPHRVRPHYGVVTDRYKLIHYYAPDVDEWELLDRQSDPLETKSFYNDPQYQKIVTELKQELQRLRVELKDDQPTPRRAFGNALFDGEAKPEASKK